MRRRMGSSSSSDRCSMLRSKTRMVPASGRVRPAMWRRSTVLPEPLPPMITSVSPLSSVSERPCRTSTVSKLFLSPLTSTMGMPRSPEHHEKELGEEEIGDDHAHGHVHHGGGGGPPQPLRAALGAEPVVATDEGHDGTEEDGLAHAGEEVTRQHPVARDG